MIETGHIEIAAFVERKWSHIRMFIFDSSEVMLSKCLALSLLGQGGVGTWNSVYMWAPASKLSKKGRRGRS